MNAQSKLVRIPPQARSAEARVSQYDWGALTAELSGYGCAVMEQLLSPDECRQIAALYPDESHFRSHIHMARHGFGKGEYRYFKYPLPDLIGPCAPRSIRTWRGSPMRGTSAWASISDIRRSMRTLSKKCHTEGQTRPTPLLLQYVPGDFNCLHQDLYGDLAFPLQVAILLSEPDAISPAASLSSRSSGRACRAAPRWCRCGRAMRWPSRFTTAR